MGLIKNINEPPSHTVFVEVVVNRATLQITARITGNQFDIMEIEHKGRKVGKLLEEMGLIGLVTDAVLAKFKKEKK